MYHCVFIIDLFLLYYTNYNATYVLPIHSTIQKALVAWIGVFVVNIITAQILSFCHLLGNIHAWLWVHAFYVSGIFIVISSRRLCPWKNLHTHHFKTTFSKIINIFISSPSWVRILCLTSLLSICLLIPLHFKNVTPINDDATGYHLPRVLQYIHQNSLEAYPTYDTRQTDFPINYEIVMIWVLTLSKDLRWIYFLQWLMVGFACMSLYLTCRSLMISTLSSIITCLLWLTTPFILLQLSFVKNDVFMSCLILYTIPFLLTLSHSFPINAAIIALCSGIMIGVKYTGLFYFTSLFLIVLIWPFYQQRSFKHLAYIGLIFFLSLFFLGSYSYLSTWYRTNSPITSHPGKTLFRFQSISINTIRLAMEMTDQLALPNEIYSQIYHNEILDIRSPLLNSVKTLPPLNVYDKVSYWPWMEGNTAFDLTKRYFQFTLGHLYFLAFGVIAACKCWNRQEIKFILTFFFIAYIMQTAVLKWQPIDNLRFYFPLLSVLYPCIGLYVNKHLYSFRFLPWCAVASIDIGIAVIFYYLYIMV